MELFNEVSDLELLDGYVGTETGEEIRTFNVFRFAMENVLLLLSPFVPHICEELWARMENAPSILEEAWPEFDAETARFEEVEIPVQVNGRVRDRLMAERDADEVALEEKALQLPGVRKHTEGTEIVKVIVVPNQIVNIVTR